MSRVDPRFIGLLLLYGFCVCGEPQYTILLGETLYSIIKVKTEHCATTRGPATFAGGHESVQWTCP
jgi:hypothetical protein